MAYWRRLGSFWLVMLFCALGGYFALFNLDYIYVNLPHFGEFKVRAAVAFIAAFFCGATVVIIYFGLDSLKKSFLLRQKNKKIDELERQLAATKGTKAPLPAKADHQPNLFD